jgi:hypothetical protein
VNSRDNSHVPIGRSDGGSFVGSRRNLATVYDYLLSKEKELLPVYSAICDALEIQHVVSLSRAKQIILVAVLPELH